MTLDEAAAHVGEKVVYRTAYGRAEEGVITSVNDRWVFVRYGASAGSMPTAPEMLTLLASKEDDR
jgi:hypothetical protein